MGLPTVWEAFEAGEVDAEQVVMIDRIARRATESGTLHTIDNQAAPAAQTRTVKQLGAWLLRLVAHLEPDAFADRHRRALADRRVTIAHGADGVGYVTGEVSALDAADIDTLLTAAARSLGAGDPRSQQQRRADLFADLLLGRLHITNDDPDASEEAAPEQDWIEVEDIDPDTGELLGTERQRLNPDGLPADDPSEDRAESSDRIAFRRLPQTRRIGIVVPLSSLLGLTHSPGQLTDRSACIPGEVLRQQIADLLHPDSDDTTSSDEALFTRLLTDDGGRLLDTTELGRFPSRRLAEAIRIRAGSCRFPTCTVPAQHCDADHHDPKPRGPTNGRNLDPGCRRHHRGKTFAWLASSRDSDTVTWTLPDDTRYQVIDDPLPTGHI